MSIPFEKWHGLGNDFVIVRREQSGLPTPDQVAAWCDRRRGVGGDGVIVLSGEGPDELAMVVLNRDGSEPEICGNGIRCAVLSWGLRQQLNDGVVTVVTGAGPKRCHFAGEHVTVDMGPARLRADDLPASATDGPARVSVVAAGHSVDGLAISMGNPHLVLFADVWPPVDPVEAGALERHTAFVNRANVSFATEPSDDRIALIVWERGVGYTQACGSAACATAVAAATTGRVGYDRDVIVALPGGDLRVNVSGDLERVAMTGPATHVFTGELAPSS